MSANKSILILSLIIISSICGIAGAATQSSAPILDWGILDNETYITHSSEGDLCILNKARQYTVTSSGEGCACDVLFLTDTTGSMGGYINNFKTALSGILMAIDAYEPSIDIMYSVADYKDYTDGGNYQTYGVNLLQPFTYDVNAVQSAINMLSASGGKDTPESQLKGMVNIAGNWITPAGDLGFNGRVDAHKFLIWAGDAPGHIAGDEPISSGFPPNGYYPTLNATINALTTQDIQVFALNATDCSSGIDLPYGSPYSQTDPLQQADEITSATSGILFCNVGSGGPSIEDAIIDAITTGLCHLAFTKIDDVNDGDCVGPGDEITYTICYSYPKDLNCCTDIPDINDVKIIDELPEGVNYISSLPQGDYNDISHTVTWQIGTISDGDINCFTLTVEVNTKAKPCSIIRNCCMIKSGEVTLRRVCEGSTKAPENCKEISGCGWNLPCDFSGDCYVNFKDYAIWALDWWRCMRYGYPITSGDASCEHPWWDSVELPCGSHYNVINIDLNGGPNDPIYSGTAAFAEAVGTNCVIGEWNSFYQGEGVLMPSPRCEDIGEPCNPGTYARAIFIADPCSHNYQPYMAGDELLDDGFVKSGSPADPNPGLFIWGTMAYGGVYDVYVISDVAGDFTIRDSNGDTQSKAITGGALPNTWSEPNNYVVFTDVEIDTPDSRDASGPNPDYAGNQEYLTDPNSVFLSYSNQIDGIQFASVKRRIMNTRGVPPGDANFTDGLWSAETPIILGLPPRRFNVFAADYDAAYETNQRDGEFDYDGPDVDWESGKVHYIVRQEQWEYDVLIDSTSDGAYKVRFLVNLCSGIANFSIYIDDSLELGRMIIELNDGVDANIPYWSSDIANVHPINGTGWLDINLFQGFRTLKIKSNTPYFEFQGFQLWHSGNLPNMNECATVIAYGFRPAGDLNNDCYVNFVDLNVFAEDWLKCNNPEDPDCIVF